MTKTHAKPHTDQLNGELDELRKQRKIKERQADAAKMRGDLDEHAVLQREIENLDNAAANLAGRLNAPERMRTAAAELGRLNNRQMEIQTDMERIHADMERVTARIAELDRLRDIAAKQAAAALLAGETVTQPASVPGIEFERQAAQEALAQLDNQQTALEAELAAIPAEIRTLDNVYRNARRYACQLELMDAIHDHLPLFARAAAALHAVVGAAPPREYIVEIPPKMVISTHEAMKVWDKAP